MGVDGLTMNIVIEWDVMSISWGYTAIYSLLGDNPGNIPHKLGYMSIYIPWHFFERLFHHFSTVVWLKTAGHAAVHLWLGKLTLKKCDHAEGSRGRNHVVHSVNDEVTMGYTV